MSRWWRAYDEAVDDPKLCLLSDKAHRAWFNLMCVTSANDGTLPHIETIAMKLRMSEKKLGLIIEELVTRGLLDEFDGALRPHNWNGRQFKSDVTDVTAAERMRNYRNRKRNSTVTDTVTVTVPRDRVQKTDTEKKEKKEAAPRRARSPKHSLPDDWRPSLESPLTPHGEQELEKMRDWARSNAIMKADWDATFRNWLRRAAEQNPRGRTNGAVRENREKGGLAGAIAQLADTAERLRESAISGSGEDAAGFISDGRRE